MIRHGDAHVHAYEQRERHSVRWCSSVDRCRGRHCRLAARFTRAAPSAIVGSSCDVALMRLARSVGTARRAQRGRSSPVSHGGSDAPAQQSDDLARRSRRCARRRVSPQQEVDARDGERAVLGRRLRLIAVERDRAGRGDRTARAAAGRPAASPAESPNSRAARPDGQQLVATERTIGAEPRVAVGHEHVHVEQAAHPPPSVLGGVAGRVGQGVVGRQGRDRMAVDRHDLATRPQRVEVGKGAAGGTRCQWRSMSLRAPLRGQLVAGSHEVTPGPRRTGIG